MPELVHPPRCDFPDALHADPTPPDYGYAVEVQCEKPWHRIAIMLAGQGYTVTEISEKLERSIAHVSILLRQDWARKRLTDEMMKAGRDELETILKGAGSEALRRVITLSQNAESEQVQLAASREVLDRLLGKPVQKLETKQDVVFTNISQADEEIAKLEQEEKRLLGRN